MNISKDTIRTPNTDGLQLCYHPKCQTCPVSPSCRVRTGRPLLRCAPVRPLRFRLYVIIWLGLSCQHVSRLSLILRPIYAEYLIFFQLLSFPCASGSTPLAAPGFPVLFCAVFPCLVCCCSRASVPLHTALPLFVRLVRLFSRLAVSVFTASLSVVLPRFRAFTFPWRLPFRPSFFPRVFPV